MNSLVIVRQKLQKIDNLPTLPVVASKLLEMLSSDNTSMGQIAEVLSTDPALTSKVLKISNSAYFGVTKRIDTIRLALVVLGMKEINNILLSISLFKTFPDDSELDFDRKEFWTHSIAVGYLAQHITKSFGIATHGEEFTAGLIHDIGKIILEQYFHDDFIEILQLIDEDGVKDFEAEEKILGVTHPDLGAWLARKWRIPSHLVEAIRYHHMPSFAQKNKLLPAIVNISNSIANFYEIGMSANHGHVHPTEAAGWDILKSKIRKNVNIEEFVDSIADRKEDILQYAEATFRTK
jgi:putative nucleotidyltransferase with HDIG domain